MTAPRWSTPYADRVRDDLVRLVEAPEASTGTAPRRTPVDRPRVLVTGVVAAIVVVLAAFAIRAGIDRPSPGPAASPSAVTAQPAPTRPPAEVRAELHEALFALLPTSARSAPSLTWSDDRGAPTGGAIDTDGRSMLLAAACEGGGTLSVIVSGSNVERPTRVLRCAELSTLGPIDLSQAGGTDPPGPVGFDVRVRSGHPRFFAKAVAVDPEEVDRARTIRP
ncbi:hypothetical protein GCM10025783_32860 [Amnibacterium soli]|uniref:Uncharacterized protein n=1 Tax=Amnibacterium soli TaxID=1282736 RepID=A0ABP8ZHE0_9MICO